MQPALDKDFDVAALGRLKQALTAAGYTRETVLATLHSDQHLLAQPGEVVVFERRVSAGRPADTLIKYFLIGMTVAPNDLEEALPGFTLEELRRLGMAEGVAGGGVRCPVRIVPHGDVLVASDRSYYRDTPGHDSDVVTGVSNPAILLADLTVRKPAKRALDLGTGGGIQALLLANHCEHVVATDLNPRALEFTRLNAALNGFRNIETRAGSWFEPVAGERFDIIAANPPYVISPETAFLYRDSGMPADSVSRELIRAMPEHLEEGGFGHILISWGVAAGQDPLEPPLRWVDGLPCDVWLLHYLTEDPLTQAAKWNRTLAMDGPEKYAESIDRWLAYYREQGIDQIAFGAVIMRRRSSAKTWVRADTLHSTRGSAAGLVSRVFDAEDYLQGASPDALIDEQFTLVPNHRLEQLLVVRDGEWHLQESTLTMTNALGFRGGLDVPTAHLLQHLDGKHTLREAIAQSCEELGLEGEDRRVLAEAAVTMARRLHQLGFLVRGVPQIPQRPLGDPGSDPSAF